MTVERLTHRHEDGSTELVCCLMSYNEQYRCPDTPDNAKCQCIGEKQAVDRLAAYEGTGLTQKQVSDLARAQREGRVLPEGFGYALLTDGTHVVFKPRMESFRVEAMGNYTASANDEAQRALEERK